MSREREAESGLGAPLLLSASPGEVVRSWPMDLPLAAMVSHRRNAEGSGAPGDAPNTKLERARREGEDSRFSVLGVPSQSLVLIDDGDGVRAEGYERVRLGGLIHEGAGPTWVARVGDPVDAISGWLANVGDAAASDGSEGGAEGVPCAVVSLGYELGRHIEPSATGDTRGRGRGGKPNGEAVLAVLHRLDAALVHDGFHDRWAVLSKPGDDGDTWARLLRDAAERVTSATASARRDRSPYALGAMVSTTGREAYEDAVRRAVGLIHAGDVFQVNLAHHLVGRFEGCTRALFADLCARARPAHGAYVEDPSAASAGRRRVIASASPELLLRADLRENSEREIITRPMKGTRSIASGEASLLASEKDGAELAMIVDLMRNDLGRVCRFGSITVPRARVIERHDVLQTVGEVRGALRAGVGFADLIRAVFPPGSVTGAPKVRAMQLIDEFETEARGAYCGCIGVVRPGRSAVLNVAIRTATVTGPMDVAGSGRVLAGELRYPVGAGIVAESDRQAEWMETLLKASAVVRLAGEPEIRARWHNGARAGAGAEEGS